jgi:hypothetical protein
MRADLTDLTVVLDRSGSMSQIQSDAEGGLNAFVAEQKKVPGECRFTLVQFDHEYEFVHKAVPIASVPHLELKPRGNTALLDAVGRAITETGERLAATPEADRPGLVVFVILTDGIENASCEFSRAKVKEMIEHQQTAYKWQFTYLGANQDAFGEAAGLGVRGAAANFTNRGTQEAFGAAHSNVARMRVASAGGQSVRNHYTDEEKEGMAK